MVNAGGWRNCEEAIKMMKLPRPQAPRSKEVSDSLNWSGSDLGSTPPPPHTRHRLRGSSQYHRESYHETLSCENSRANFYPAPSTRRPPSILRSRNASSERTGPERLLKAVNTHTSSVDPPTMTTVRRRLTAALSRMPPDFAPPARNSSAAWPPGMRREPASASDRDWHADIKGGLPPESTWEFQSSHGMISETFSRDCSSPSARSPADDSPLGHIVNADASSASRGHVSYLTSHVGSLRMSVSGRAVIADAIAHATESIQALPALIRMANDCCMLSPYFDALRDFAVDHNDQVREWCEGFSRWDDFVGALLSEFQIASGTALQVEDTLLVLRILPPGAVLSIYRKLNKRQKAELELEPLVEKTCSIPHLPAMAYTLSACLAAGRAYLEATHALRWVRNTVEELDGSNETKSLFSAVRRWVSGHRKTFGRKVQSSTRTSLWYLMRLCLDRPEMRAFLSTFLSSDEEIREKVLHQGFSYISHLRNLSSGTWRGAVEIEGLVTQTSLFLSGISTSLNTHLTYLSTIDDAIENAFGTVIPDNEGEGDVSKQGLFADFNVRPPPFHAELQLEFIANLDTKLLETYESVKKKLGTVLGAKLAIIEMSRWASGPPPPISMAFEILGTFLRDVDAEFDIIRALPDLAAASTTVDETSSLCLTSASLSELLKPCYTK